MAMNKEKNCLPLLRLNITFFFSSGVLDVAASPLLKSGAAEQQMLFEEVLYVKSTA